MKKTFHFWWTIVLLLMLLVSVPLQANLAANTKVLLIYDAADSSLLGPTHQLLMCFEKEVTSLEADDYEKGMEKTYDYVVLTTSKPFAKGFTPTMSTLCIGTGYDAYIPKLSIEIISETKANLSLNNWQGTTPYTRDFPVITAYEGIGSGQVELAFNRTYPFSVKMDKLTCIPYVYSEDISFLGLGTVLNDLFVIAETLTSLYLTLEPISIASDLNQLVQTADAFYSYGIPFMVKVTPLYQNFDYPAFLRFATALRYMQYRGGTILLEVPEPTATEEVLALQEKLGATQVAFEANGIEVFTLNTTLYPLSLEYLSSISSKDRMFGDLPFNATLVCKLPQTPEAIDQLVNRLNSKWLSFYDIYPLHPSRTFDADDLEALDLTPIEEAPTGSYQGFFHRGNQFLFLVVGASIILFIGIIALGRYLYRQKFYSNKRGHNKW